MQGEEQGGDRGRAGGSKGRRRECCWGSRVYSALQIHFFSCGSCYRAGAGSNAPSRAKAICSVSQAAQSRHAMAMIAIIVLLRPVTGQSRVWQYTTVLLMSSVLFATMVALTQQPQPQRQHCSAVIWQKISSRHAGCRRCKKGPHMQCTALPLLTATLSQGTARHV